MEELLRIKREIEETPADDYGTIASAEFAWLYRPGKPLEPLEKVNSQGAAMLTASARRMGGNIVVARGYSDTDAVAEIVNHPSGVVHPSIDDINSLLGGISRNQQLYIHLIPATKSGIVTGFYELAYTGERSDIGRLVGLPEQMRTERYEARSREFKEHPGRFPHLRIGSPLLSADEVMVLIQDIMESCNLEGVATPIPGYKFDNWQFFPDTTA